MMKAIGRKKIILILLLFLISGGMAGYIYAVLKPELERNERQLKATTSELTELKNKIFEIEDEIAFYEANKDKYKVMKSSGFFRLQQRTLIQTALDDSQRLSGILGGGFQVASTACYLNKDLEDSDYVIISSPVTMQIEAYEDLSIYNFITEFRKQLPGFAVIESFEIGKTRELTRAVLQEIGTGEKVPMISANIVMKWYTIANKQDVQC